MDKPQDREEPFWSSSSFDKTLRNVTSVALALLAAGAVFQAYVNNHLRSRVEKLEQLEEKRQVELYDQELRTRAEARTQDAAETGKLETR